MRFFPDLTFIALAPVSLQNPRTCLYNSEHGRGHSHPASHLFKHIPTIHFAFPPSSKRVHHLFFPPPAVPSCHPRAVTTWWHKLHKLKKKIRKKKQTKQKPALVNTKTPVTFSDSSLPHMWVKGQGSPKGSFAGSSWRHPHPPPPTPPCFSTRAQRG